MLTGVDYADDFSIVVEHRRTAVAGVGCDGQLESSSIFLKTGCGAEVSFIVDDLGARVTKRKEVFAEVSVRFADAIRQAIECVIGRIVYLERGKVCLRIEPDKPRVVIPKGVLNVDLFG